jgi:hypothetical protein
VDTYPPYSPPLPIINRRRSHTSVACF